ncbi:MAG: DUF4097 domain-containing protein [Acetatifactor sp.]|nr:DUF4097 domain-containing protein [Acetatifactor sp.]
MKSFVKGCAIAALFLFGLGMTMVIAGCALGGVDETNKIVQEVKDKIPADVKEKVQGILDSKIYSIDDFGGVFKDGEKTLEGDVKKFSLSADGVEKIKLDIGGCEVTILDSEDDDFWVEAKNVQKFQAYVDGETLHVVNTSKEKTISGLNIKNVKITLYVPEGLVFDKAEIELGAGIIHSDAFAAKKAEIKIGAGDLQLKSMDSDDVKIQIGAGNVEIGDASIDKLECKVGAGNFTLKGELHDDVKVDCAMGNISLDLKNAYKDFDYEVKCSAGNIDLNGKKYTGLSKEEKIDNDAEHEMKLECSVGNVDVSFK